MIDLRIVQARVLLKVTSVAPIRSFVPPSIVVVGVDLNLTQSVLYNNIEADDFIINSPSRLIVKIPVSQVGKEFRDLKVFSTVVKSGLSASVILGLLPPLSKVQGVERLAQSWFMVWNSNPNTDVFSPSSGGGGRALIGRNTDVQGTSIGADLQLSVEKTNTEIQQLQASLPNIPLDEKFLSGTIQQIQFSSSTGTLSAQLAIMNVLGQMAGLNLGG